MAQRMAVQGSEAAAGGYVEAEVKGGFPLRKVAIGTNAVVSAALALTGVTRMVLRDPLLGGGYEFAALMWIVGVVTLFLIPLEICLIKPRREV